MRPRRTQPPLGRRRLLLAALLLALLAVALLRPQPAAAQREDLLERIGNERMRNYEERLTTAIDDALARYLPEHQYVLAVKVMWNPNIVPVADRPEFSSQRQKLPGLPLFVQPPGQQRTEGGTPPITRLEVKVLLDETLPEYYERFVRKLVPVVARFDFERGDTVVVLKETFPEGPQQARPSTVPEQELMRQLERQVPQEQRAPQPPDGIPQVPQAPQVQPGGPGEAAPEATAAARVAYEEGRYQDALRIAQQGFQRATTNRERAFFLGMEGSVHYTMGNQQAARQAWERALVFDPSNMEIHRVLNFLDRQEGGSAQGAQGGSQ